jgi:hypothetical protein
MLFDWPEPTAYLAVLAKDVQETFLCIFYSIFTMKKCNSPLKRKGFIIKPAHVSGLPRPGIGAEGLGACPTGDVSSVGKDRPIDAWWPQERERLENALRRLGAPPKPIGLTRRRLSYR